MRILHIVGTISPAAGGPTEVIRTLIRFAPAGTHSEVATLDDPAAPFLRGANGEPTLDFPVHALGSSQKRWYVPAFAAWLRANRTRFDGVIVHGLWEFTGLAARLSLASGPAAPTPYVVFPHGMLDPYFKRAFPSKHLKKWVYWLLAEYWVLRGALRALFTTQLEADLARQSFWLHRWTPLVVAIGAEPPPPDPAPLLAAFAARCPELVGTKFLLFLGRIDPKKGPDLLLEAFAHLAPAHPDLHLVMAGPETVGYGDQLRSTLDPAVAARVHWPGMIRGDAKWGAFLACDAFVLPSHQENFGIAVVEALACGKPVLISDQINIAPEIAADKSGLVAPDTAQGTLMLLQEWLKTHESERKWMSGNALKTFQTRYDMRQNAATILNVFAQTSENQ